MKQTLFLLYFILTSSYLLGQSNNNRSIENEINVLEKKGDSLNKLKKYDKALIPYELALAVALDSKITEKQLALYKKIGIHHYRTKQYNIAQKMYLNGLRLDSTSKMAADLNYNLFLIKRKKNEQDSILFYLEKSLSLYKVLELDKSSYNAFLNAGIIYKNRQLYNAALEYLFKAYSGFTSIKDEKKIAYVCTTIANIQNRLKNYNQALNYHKQAFKIHKKLNNPDGIGRCYSNIGSVYDNLGLRDSAITNYKNALHFIKSGNKQYPKILNNLANTYQKIGKVKLAETYYKNSTITNKHLKDTIALLHNYTGLTSLYLKRNMLLKTRQYLDTLSTLITSSSNKILILSYYENEVEYHQKNKNYKTALDFQLKYSSLYEEIYDNKQTEIVQSAQAQFDYEKRENKILKLSLDNKNKQLELIKKNEDIGFKNGVVLILVFIVLLLLAAHYVFIQKQKVAQQNIKIEKLEAIYEGQEIIKKRISRDLHDIITTNFDGLRLRILALKRSSSINEIDDITDKIKNINQQIRVVSHRLYPLEMHMGNQKFTDVIKSRLSEFQLYGNIFVELENKFPDILNSADLVIQNNFYGILLEVLNNVEKHSLATKINIKNYLDNKSNLHFIFTDNGIGIKDNPKEGIGLLNIKQRCEILGGTCTIQKVASGTEAHISFPILKNV